MRRICLLFVCLCCAIAGCMAPPAIELPASANPPPEWPAFSSARFEGTECPVVDGVYVDEPEIFEQPAGEGALERETWTYFRVFPMSLAEVAVGEVRSPYSNRNWFSVHQENAGVLELSFLERSADRLATYKFSAQEGDFTCVDGRIEFPRVALYGMIEGTTSNFQVRRELSIDESGALVLYWARGIYRSNSFEANEPSASSWFRYAKAVGPASR